MEKIDIVIPWVDGSDPKWKKKKEEYLSNKRLPSNDEMVSQNRYDDYGTLKYVMRSIEENMPWVGNVFLLTDNQRPKWVNTQNVKVVDHTSFIQGNLPTFNSNVIMMNLHNIPGLAERFVLLNDDTIIWSKTAERDFFKGKFPVDILVETGTVPKIDGFFHISQNGVALMNESFNKRDVIKNNFSKFFSLKYGLTIVRTIISLPYGGFVGFLNPHLALPYTRQDFLRFETNFPEAVQTTSEHRFRDSTDINDWAVRYFRNLEGRFVPGKLRGQFLTTSQFSGDVSIANTEQVVVINDDNQATEADIGRVISILEAKFTRKSKYEL